MKLLVVLIGSAALVGFSPRSLGLASVSVSPYSLMAGQNATGTVKFDAMVRRDVQVTLSSSNGSVARVPGSVIMRAGTSSATFMVTTGSPGCAGVHVKYDRVNRHADVFVHSTSTPVRLTIDKLSSQLPASFKGTVSITRPRGSTSLTGDVVTLSSSNAGIASVPRSVTVPAASTTVSFDIRPAGFGCAVITATYGGGKSERAMMIQPDQ